MTHNPTEALREALCDWVVRVAQEARITEPVFFLCIAYAPETPNDFPPPMVGIGLDRERRTGVFADRMRHSVDKWTHRGDAIKQDWYNPANYSNFQSASVSNLWGS